MARVSHIVDTVLLKFDLPCTRWRTYDSTSTGSNVLQEVSVVLSPHRIYTSNRFLLVSEVLHCCKISSSAQILPVDYKAGLTKKMDIP